MSELKIIVTPALKEADELMKEITVVSGNTSCLGLITGPNGCGKTESLRYIERRFNTVFNGQRALYHRCCNPVGSTRLLRDILNGLGMRATLMNSVFTQQFLIRLLLKEFAARNIRLLLLDEADTCSEDTLNSLVALVDSACEQQLKLGLILVAQKDLKRWFMGNLSGFSRTLRQLEMLPLDLQLSLAVLREWHPQFEAWVKHVEQQQPEALKIAKLLQKSLSGNFRKLWFFRELYFLKNREDEPLTAERVAKVLDQMFLEVTK